MSVAGPLRVRCAGAARAGISLALVSPHGPFSGDFS